MYFKLKIYSYQSLFGQSLHPRPFCGACTAVAVQLSPPSSSRVDSWLSGTQLDGKRIMFAQATGHLEIFHDLPTRWTKMKQGMSLVFLNPFRLCLYPKQCEWNFLVNLQQRDPLKIRVYGLDSEPTTTNKSKGDLNPNEANSCSYRMNISGH